MLGKDSTSDFDEADVKLIDCASLIHSLRLDRSIKTFHEYAEKKVIPFSEKHLATTKHVVIWDKYLSKSLKVTTRQCRGARVRQQLPSYGNGKIPKKKLEHLSAQ